MITDIGSKVTSISSLTCPRIEIIREGKILWKKVRDTCSNWDKEEVGKQSSWKVTYLLCIAFQKKGQDTNTYIVGSIPRKIWEIEWGLSLWEL